MTPRSARGSYFDEGYGDPRFTSLPSTRRTGVARWVVGLVAIGLTTVGLVTVGSKYIKATSQARPLANDERIPTLIQEGEWSLADGDVETAREKFLKASALAEDDPRVAGGLARIEMVSAEARWLRLQLLAPDDPDREPMRHELSVAAERARKAVDHARRVAPTDPAVARAAIDLLRMQGELASARRLVGEIAAASAQPENALTLAALDLAEAQPSWPAVIERLRTAASSEQSLGRARALLVYALARSGDLAAARAEQERLLAAGRPNPLARPLRAFIDRLDRAQGKAQPDAGIAPAAAGSRPDARPPATRGDASSGAPERNPRAPDPGDGRVPDDYVAPGGVIDTSDLPGVQPPPVAPHAASAEPRAPTPRDVDTSDLPGFKND